MTSDGAMDIREIVQVGGARKAFDAMPDTVQERFDRLFSLVQNNVAVPKNDRKNLEGNLSGISELRVSFDDDTYRSYFAAEYREVIILLDAGIKKSRKDREIPKEQKVTLLARKKRADEFYAAHREEFEKRFRQREENRKRRIGGVYEQ